MHPPGFTQRVGGSDAAVLAFEMFRDKKHHESMMGADKKTKAIK